MLLFSMNIKKKE